MTFPGTGPDFARARRDWLYQSRTGQPLVVAVAFLVLLFLFNSVLQYVFGIASYYVLFSGAESYSAGALAKASIVGLLPAAVLTIFAAFYLQKFFNVGQRSGIPMHVPALGPGGWFVVLAGFAIGMYVVYAGVVTLLGIDPQAYMPTAGGVEDSSSSAGLVEKAMADLASEPMLFAFAVPGVAIAVPMAEEVIFRGVIFSALLYSPMGKTGAVIITAALWAIVHGAAAPWLFVGVIFVMGLVLGLLLLRFGSLWVTIACHGLWNALSSVAIFGNVGAQ